MTYGLQIRRGDGNLQWESTSTERVQVMLPAISCSAGSGTVVSYPSLAGYAVETQSLAAISYSTSGGAASEPTIDYALGYPRITVPSRSFIQYILVYLK